MAKLEPTAVRKAIKEAGHSWTVRKLPANEPPHGLGLLPSDPVDVQQAIATAKVIARARIRVAPTGGPQLSESAALKASVPAAAASMPGQMDWRTRGVIGPVRNQAACGSCVSFATTGMTSAMAAIELGARNLQLSEADQHFCSSHGANCGGWNNADALGQIKSRGVVTDLAFPYMSAFDNPPVKSPTDPNVWVAHCRGVSNREYHCYRITDYSGWPAIMLGLPFDMRKYYLANIGPMVCGFTVYEDFDVYGGGVYHHVTGKVRGGHAVMVVGYSDSEHCWICRNSWGSNFGGVAHADGTGAGFFKIGYGECNIDNEPFYGCHGVIAPATLPVVSSVSRSADKLDVFAAGTDHGIYTAAWQPGDAAWRGWWRVAGGVAAPGTSIYGVSRSANKLDIFAVGTDHGIYTAAWQPGDTAFRGWWRIAGGVAAPNSSVHGVSRSANKLDVFAVGTDHGVYTAAWEPGDTTWRGWWRIGNLQVAPGTSVHAVSRSPDHLDIFAVGADQRIYTAAWQPGWSTWHGWWQIAGGVAAPNTSVFGVSRSTDHLDVFAVGTDHGIYTAAWQPGWPTWHGWWQIAGGVAAAGTSVYGVSRSTDHLDVFAIGTDHGIYTAAWQPGFTGWHGWWRVAGGVAEGG